MNNPVLELNENGRIFSLIDNQDLTHFRLARNCPMLNNYNQWKVDKVETHWRVLDMEKDEYRFLYSKKAMSFHVQNDTNVAAYWGSVITDPDQGVTEDTIIYSLLLDPYQLAGCKMRKHSPLGGKVSFSPYITESITTLAKQNPNNAPAVITDIRHNYKKMFHYKSSQVQYENPAFLVVPPIERLSRNTKGDIMDATVDPPAIKETVNWFEKNDYFPKLERYSYVYVTAKQCNQFYTGGQPSRIYDPLHHVTQRVLPSNYEPLVNGIHDQINNIKQEIQSQVQAEVVNSHPIMTAAAGLLGLAGRKRMRHDEIK